jgi:hypothetical protein
MISPRKPPRPQSTATRLTAEQRAIVHAQADALGPDTRSTLLSSRSQAEVLRCLEFLSELQVPESVPVVADEREFLRDALRHSIGTARLPDKGPKIVVMSFGRCHANSPHRAESTNNPGLSVRNELSPNALIISSLQHMMRRIKHLAAQLVQAKPSWPNRP